MFFTDIKLSAKLGLAFSLAVFLTLIMGGFSLMQMSAIHSRTEDIAGSWLPSVRVLGEIRMNVNLIRRSEADYLLSSTESERAVGDKRIADAKALLSQQMVAYEPLITSPQERLLADRFRSELGEYLALQPRLFEIARSNEGNLQAATSFFRGASRDALGNVNATLAELVKLNNQGGIDAADDARKDYGSARGWVAGLLLVILVVCVVMATLIVRSVARQLGGEPADAARLARSVAGGDLSVAIALQDGDDHSMLAQMRRMQQSLSRVVSDVRGNAESVAAASSQISQGNADLSQRTEEQASALEETAASMEQLNSTVRQNADNARQANQLAVSASTVAARGGEVVGQVVDTMRGINESSKRIADIISVIDSIAFQTNILALNAAVEAARAGEQGRGFAVVASEVRSLAQRSAAAAKEIKALISSSVSQVEQGTTLVDQAGSTMREIVESIRSVADLMGEISAASTEQSQGVAQIGEAITQMDQVTQQNAALVEESAAAAASLKQQAQQLVDAVAVFKLMDSVAEMRPAEQLAGFAKVPGPARPAARNRPAALAVAAKNEDWASF